MSEILKEMLFCQAFARRANEVQQGHPDKDDCDHDCRNDESDDGVRHAIFSMTFEKKEVYRGGRDRLYPNKDSIKAGKKAVSVSGCWRAASENRAGAVAWSLGSDALRRGCRRLANDRAGLRPFVALNNVKEDFVATFESFVTVFLNRSEMDEDIFAAFVPEKAVAFDVVEPLHYSLVFAHRDSP
jgi:hypothetical protein